MFVDGPHDGSMLANRSGRQDLDLKTAVAGPKMAHLAKITAAFEFSVLTLTGPARTFHETAYRERREW
jgi:hypothetical protein